MAKLRVDKIAAPIVKDEFTGSVFFDGNGDHLDVPLSDDFKFGAGDFTIEAWVYLVEEKDQAIFGTNNSGSSQGYELDVFTNGSIRFYSGNGSAYNYGALGLESSAGAVPQQTWTHIVASRQGGTLRLFVNGVLSVSNTSFTHTITDSTIAPDIGNDGRSTGTSYHTHGYISNFRVCKGHAVYTENFTAPTRELEVHLGAKGVVFPAADNRTVLLACQSSTDTTAEATGRHTLTANGNATAADANPGLFRRTNVSSTTTENTGSVYFDGTDDRLDIAHSTDFRIADSNTFECWIYYNSLPGNNLFLGVESSYWVGYNHTGVGGASNKFVFTIYNGSSWQAVSSSTTPVVGTWYHIAAVKDGTSLKMFVNGVLENTTTMSGTAAAVTDFFNIGKWNQASAGQGVDGYLSNVRVCKGHAVYTSNFAPPTTELEVHEGPDDDRTVLLACYDGENIFADKTGRHIIAAYGDRLSSPTPTATDSPIGITTNYPPVTRNVDPTDGPTFQGGAGFTSQNWLTLPKGTTYQRSRGRGVRAGGYSGTTNATIEYFNIAYEGESRDFGDLTVARETFGGCSSTTRGLFAAGNPGSSPNNTDNIDYITIAATGNAVDFGNLGQAKRGIGSCSNKTRGIFAGGNQPGTTNIIDYVTIATIANTNDFGDLTSLKSSFDGCSSPTRALFGGGNNPSVTDSDVIDYVTIATTGNALDFGNLTDGRRNIAGCSSSTRAIFGGGRVPGLSTIIDYVTISTIGNATDFGDLTVSRNSASGVSNDIRGVFQGGSTPGVNATIDFVTIATTANATAWGTLKAAAYGLASASDSHGGLS